MTDLMDVLEAYVDARIEVARLTQATENNPSDEDYKEVLGIAKKRAHEMRRMLWGALSRAFHSTLEPGRG